MSRNSEERGFDLDEGRPGGGAPRGRTGGRRFRRRKICRLDRKSTRLNSSHSQISYAVFCLKKKKQTTNQARNNVGNPTDAAGCTPPCQAPQHLLHSATYPPPSPSTPHARDSGLTRTRRLER